MNLNDVNRGIKKNKKRTRIGRGPGSGHGKTSGRGHKGQGQDSGWSAHPAFEGGQFPLARRVPKRGFNNKWAKSVFAVNVSALDEAFSDGEDVTVDKLQTLDIAKGRYDRLKILGDGELTKKLKVTAHQFSKTAIEKIQAAGGEVVVIPGPKPVVKNKMRPARKKS